VGGGGASDPAWIPLLRQALGLPVEGVPDPWAGCRGALLATGFLVAPDAVSETSPPATG
jgi:sugar (pentulose or hexulose) kinase